MLIVDGLRRDGVVEQGVALPQIAVVGDQSSGKSSVLENITGIPFPKGTGTVTKCATRITIVRSTKPQKPFSARVSFTLREVDSPFKDEKEAILHKSMEELQDTLERLNGCLDRNQKTVVSDVIEVSIEEPMEKIDVVELSIVDLPGLIATTVEGQSADLVNSIKAMVKEYAEDSRTVILAIMEAHRDISNSRSLAMAEAADPKGERTVGVLTKMDLVEERTENNVLQILNNKRKVLRHGYYAVMNRAQKGLEDGQSLEEARNFEEKWFNTAGHYKSQQHRCGIKALKRGISTRLFDILKKGLPKIVKELKHSVKETRERIVQLGPKPPSTEAEMLLQLNGLINSIHEKVIETTKEAFIEENSVPTLWRCQLESRKEFTKGVRGSVIKKFKYELIEMPSVGGRKTSNNSTIDKLLEENKFSDVIIREKPFPEEKTPQILKCPKGTVIEVEDNGNFFSGVVTSLDETSGKLHVTRSDGKNSETSIAELTYFRQFKVVPSGVIENALYELGMKESKLHSLILADIREHRGRELQGFPSFQVFLKHFKELSSGWEAPMITFFKSMNDSFIATITRILEKECSAHPRVKSFLSEIFNEWFERKRKVIHQKLEIKFQDEQSYPMTENHYYMDTVAKIKAERMKKYLLPHFSGNGQMELKQVQQILGQLIESWNKGRSNEDSEAEYVRDFLKAYYKVARKRFVDNIAQVMRLEYLDKTVLKDLRNFFTTKSFKNKTRLFVHDEDQILRRQELKKTLASLEKGLRRIENN